MTGYEYIRIGFDFNDLDYLNGLGSVGWRIIWVTETSNPRGYPFTAMLERPLSEEQRKRSEGYWSSKADPK